MGDQKRVDTAKADSEELTFTDRAGSEHRFKSLNDDDATANKAIEDILAGHGDPATLVRKVAESDFVERAQLAHRMDEVAKVATGDDMLAIADLIGMQPIPKIRKALTAKTPPSTGTLRAHIVELPPNELFVLLDAATLDTLKLLYTPPAAVVPLVAAFDERLLAHKDLVAWYVTTSPPSTVALNVMQDEAANDDYAEQLAGVLNSLGPKAWDWALAVSPQMAARAEQGTARKLAQFCSRPDVRDHLQSVAQPLPRSQEGTAPISGAQLEKLAPASGMNVDALVDAVLSDRAFHRNDIQVLTRSPYRERILAAASFSQLEILAKAIHELDFVHMLDWLVASPAATAEDIRRVTARWADAWLSSDLTATRLTTIMTRFPDAGPTNVFGSMTGMLLKEAVKNPTLRRWFARNPEPRTLLHLVAHDVNHLKAMWNGLIADGLPATWVQGLGAGNGDDTELRRLALNCPDPDAAAWIRERILGDVIETEQVSNTGTPIPSEAFERDPRKRFEEGLAAEGTTDMGERTNELSDEDLAKLRDDPVRLGRALGMMSEKWVVHTILRIEPPLPLVLAHTSPDTTGLPGYIRGRSGSEVVAAFADANTATRIQQRVRDPFVRFPQLHDPQVLAGVMTTPDTLTWLLKWTDGPYAIEVLGQKGVAAAAGPLFTKDHLKLLPTTMVLNKDRQAALKRLAKHVPDALGDDLRDRVADDAEGADADQTSNTPKKADKYSWERADIDARQDELAAALAHPDLADALEVVLRDPVSIQNVLAVCRERASGAAVLVGDPKHAGRVAKLADTVRDSPLGVFPSTPYHAFLHIAPSRMWLMEQESPIDLLRAAETDPQISRFMFGKAKPDDAALAKWFSRMPRGSALSAKEKRIVRHMFDAAENDGIAELLFGVRFGPNVDKGVRGTTAMTKAELTRLWAIFERVPDSHIDQGSISSIYQGDLGGYVGVFGGGSYGLKTGIFENDGKAAKFDQGNAMTKAELVAAYGYTEAQLLALTSGDNPQIKVDKDAKPEPLYTIQPSQPAQLDDTVLHEVGHAVDEMLGSHTELIYSLAGWRQYGEADIDQLANDLGGWGPVTSTDQQKIRDAWVMWLNAGYTVFHNGMDSFVPTDHPAIADTYKGVGIVDIGRRKTGLGLDTPLFEGHFVSASPKYQKFYRVPQKTRDAGPSSYGMTSPQEYFAECYAQYYAEYTGPGTEDKKGIRLAGWIKSWFDTNVDTLQHNPSRKDR